MKCSHEKEDVTQLKILKYACSFYFYNMYVSMSCVMSHFPILIYTSLLLSYLSF